LKPVEEDAKREKVAGSGSEASKAFKERSWGLDNSRKRKCGGSDQRVQEEGRDVEKTKTRASARIYRGKVARDSYKGGTSMLTVKKRGVAEGGGAKNLKVNTCLGISYGKKM